jgi:putative acetyltransferase
MKRKPVPPGFAVRPMRDGDVDAFVALFARVAAEGTWIATEAPFHVADFTRRVRLGLRATGSGNAEFVAVHVESEAVVGQIRAFRLPGEPARASVGMLLDSGFRGRGLGGALLDAAIAWAREARLHGLELEVFPHNAAALRLYRSRGFRDEELRRGAISRRNGECWDALAMRLELEPAPEERARQSSWRS